MTAREPIVLPCGVSMEFAFASWSAPNGASLTPPDSWGGSDDEWQACHPAGFSEIGVDTTGTRDHCVAWLNAAMLAAQAEALPPGAFIVRPDDPETIERIAEALLIQSIRRGMFTFFGRPTDAEEQARKVARAVLAALKPPAPECDGGKP